MIDRAKILLEYHSYKNGTFIKRQLALGDPFFLIGFYCSKDYTDKWRVVVNGVIVHNHLPTVEAAEALLDQELIKLGFIIMTTERFKKLEVIL